MGFSQKIKGEIILKKLLYVVIFMLVASTSFGQSNKGWDGVRPEVWKGSRAMVFMYTPFQSNLGSINAGSSSLFQDSTSAGETNLAGVGVQFYLSPNWSLTGGLNFGSGSTEATFTSGTSKLTSTTLGLAVDFDYHMTSMYSISPYVGLNASFAMVNAKLTQTSGSTTSTIETKGSGFGAGLNMGFDWYFTPGMSLGGKYTLGFRSNSAPEGTGTTGSSSVTVKGPSSSFIGTGIMSVMLKVHF